MGDECFQCGKPLPEITHDLVDHVPDEPETYKNCSEECLLETVDDVHCEAD